MQIRQVQRLVRSEVSPLTSSIGRLFDGVASMVLGISPAGFEGEPAMRLEAACDETDHDLLRPLACCTLDSTDSELRVGWRPIVRQVVAELQAGISESVIAMRFHCAMANAVGMVAERFPGKVIDWIDRDPVFGRALVEFGGIRRECPMACVPDAEVGDYTPRGQS